MKRNIRSIHTYSLTCLSSECDVGIIIIIIIFVTQEHSCSKAHPSIQDLRRPRGIQIGPFILTYMHTYVHIEVLTIFFNLGIASIRGRGEPIAASGSGGVLARHFRSLGNQI